MKSRPIFILLICFSMSSFGQVYKFEVFGLESGLVSNEVYDLYQDPKGYIWACTDNGVTRFNGEKFSKPKSFQSNSIETIFKVFHVEDYFYFNAFDGSVIRCKSGELTHQVIFYNLQFGSGNWVYDITKQGGDVLFFYEFGGYYSKGNPSDTERVKIEPVIGDQILSNGRIRINLIQELNGYVLLTDLVTGNRKIRKLTAYQGSTILSVGKSIYIFKQFKHLKTLSFNSDIIATQDIAGKLMLASYDGLFLINQNFEIENRIWDEPVSDIMLDREGVYWISTLNSGVLRTSSLLKQVISPPSFNGSQISELKNFKDHLFVGTSMGEFALFDSAINAPITFGSLDKKTYIRDVYEYNDELIVNGIPVLKWSESKFTTPRIRDVSDPKKVKIDSLTIRASLTSGYTISYNIDSSNSSIFVDFNEKILQMLFDGNHSIYLTTFNGLYKLDLDDLQQPNPVFENDIPRGKITSLVRSNDLLFIGTASSSLFVVNRENEVQKIGEVTTIPNDFDLVKGNKLFVATDDGIYKYNLNSKGSALSAQLLAHFTSKDILVSDQIISIAHVKGKIFYATNAGLSYFPIDELPNDSINLPLISELQIEVDDQIFFDQKFIRLPPNKNDVIIKFLGISTLMPDDNFYRYRVLNSENEKEWGYTDSKELILTNLNPGEYTIQLAARNYRNQWSDIKEIVIDIEKPLTQQLWFRLSITSVGLLIIFFLLRVKSQFDKRKLKEKNHLMRLEKQYIDAELSSIKSLIKPHFIFNALQSVQTFIIRNKMEGATEYLNMFSELIRDSLQFSTLEFIPVSEEVKFIARYLSIEQQRFPERFSYEVTVDERLLEEEVMMPPLVVQPLCENAVKHAFIEDHAENKIRVHYQIGSIQDTIECSIVDNGIGFGRETKKHKYPSKGMSLIQKRINMLVNRYGVGSIEIEEDNGLIIKLILPVE